MSRRSNRPTRPIRQKARIRVEQLEARLVLSVPGYSPQQLQQAYGFNKITFNGGAVQGDGTGQTIAIVDAFDNPYALQDLQAFDQQFGLPDPGPTTFSFQTLYAQGSQPTTDTGWALEMDLDVEWAHAIAPKANIILVEAADNSDANLYAADQFAASQPGVVVVSNSWGQSEYTTERNDDINFTTPSGHAPVSFVFSSGDSGKPGGYPAYSPNVVSVGGTTLNLDSAGNWLSETGWGNGSLSFLLGGSGGGISKYEPKPAYQKPVKQSSTKRTNPDISYNADPNTGVAVYSQLNGGWQQVGGTSAGAPQIAAMIAIVDQGRLYNSTASQQGPLGTNDLLTKLYQVNQLTDFHDITKGNNGYAAAKGYDLVTGRGSPVANLLVRDLVSTVATTSAAATTTATPKLVGKVHTQLVLPDPTPINQSPVSIAPVTPVDTARNLQAFFSTTSAPVLPTFQATAFPAAATLPSGSQASASTSLGALPVSLSGGSDQISIDLGKDETIPVMPRQIQEEKATPPAPATPASGVAPMESSTQSMSRLNVDSFFMAVAVEEQLPASPATAPEGSPLPASTLEPSAGLVGLAALLSGCWTTHVSREEERRQRRVK